MASPDLVQQLVEVSLSPPWVFVIVGSLGFSCMSSLATMFREELQPVTHALLDVLAAAGRGMLACSRGSVWCLHRLVYPIKERAIGRYDACDSWMFPYKAKQPGHNIPTFQF
mmetsp:Transcript_55424/g.179795  ORF Transcript_55424/g.179795 Transcript_55424/m.179795 type:complete len:112 (+) Transcript_55424:229-564(+)